MVTGEPFAISVSSNVPPLTAVDGHRRGLVDVAAALHARADGLQVERTSAAPQREPVLCRGRPGRSSDRLAGEREGGRRADDPARGVLGELSERERVDAPLRQGPGHRCALGEHVHPADLAVPEHVRPDRVPVRLAVVDVRRRRRPPRRSTPGRTRRRTRSRAATASLRRSGRRRSTSRRRATRARLEPRRAADAAVARTRARRRR